MIQETKIIVIGCSGGGKSTFSKQLAAILNLPLYNLDNIYWLPDTSHLPRHAFKKRQRQIMKENGWIIDGNYSHTVGYRIKRCRLAYFFDMPTEVCLNGVLTRNRKRDDIACELEPNEELLDAIRAFPFTVKPKILHLFEKYPKVKVITFHSHEEVNAYLEALRREYGLNI